MRGDKKDWTKGKLEEMCVSWHGARLIANDITKRRLNFVLGSERNRRNQL